MTRAVPIMDMFSVLPTSATRIESEAVLKVGLSRIAGPSLAHARLVSPWRMQLLIALHRYSPGGEYDGNEYGGLPVNPSVFVITLSCSAFQLWAACR
jgi:hypothetical protein